MQVKYLKDTAKAMRAPLFAVVATLLVAGCITDGPKQADPEPTANDVADPEVPESTVYEPATTVFGDFRWHELQGATPNSAVIAAEWAGQHAVPGCLDPTTSEPDAWNLPLDAMAAVPNGTHSLQVLFSWDPTSYIRDELVLAYRPAGSDTWALSEYLTNGEPGQVPVDASAWEPAGRSTAWQYAACLVREEHRNVDAGADWRPGAFRGILHVEITTVA